MKILFCQKLFVKDFHIFLNFLIIFHLILKHNLMIQIIFLRIKFINQIINATY